MFSGSRFARPHECRHEPSRMFYVCGGQLCEVFGVKQLDSVEKIDHVQGKCAILTLKQYESCEYILYKINFIQFINLINNQVGQQKSQNVTCLSLTKKVYLR